MSKNRNKYKSMTPTELIGQVAPQLPEVEVKEEVVEVVKASVVEEVKPTTVVRTIPLANSKADTVIPVAKNKEYVPESIMLIRQHIDNYVTAVSSKVHRSNAKVTNVNLLKNILLFVISKQDIVVIEEVYRFFKKYRNTLLSPELALKGIDAVPAQTQEKIQQAYTLFYHVSGASGNKAKKLDIEYAAKFLGDGNLIAYIAKKMI